MCTDKTEAGCAFVCYDMLSPSTNLSAYASITEAMNPSCSVAESDQVLFEGVPYDEDAFEHHYEYRSGSEAYTETSNGSIRRPWSYSVEVSSYGGFYNYFSEERSLHLIYSTVQFKESDPPELESSSAMALQGFVLVVAAIMFM